MESKPSRIKVALVLPVISAGLFAIYAAGPSNDGCMDECGNPFLAIFAFVPFYIVVFATVFLVLFFFPNSGGSGPYDDGVGKHIPWLSNFGIAVLSSTVGACLWSLIVLAYSQGSLEMLTVVFPHLWAAFFATIFLALCITRRKNLSGV